MPAQVELPVSSPAHNTSGSSARLAIFLSAAVCPGAGHFAQRRWIMGALYIAAFVACLVMTLLAAIVPLMMNLRIILDFADTGSSEPLQVISLVKVLTWFGLSVLVYLAALVDVIAYARRQVRRRLDENRKAMVAAQKVFSVRCSAEHNR